MNFNSKYNPFGNFDEPQPKPELWPDKPYWFRWLLWTFYRNPCHNLVRFWPPFGFKDYPLDYTQIWNTQQKWNLILPFFSYRGKKWEGYVGWRPSDKAFGIAMRRR